MMQTALAQLELPTLPDVEVAVAAWRLAYPPLDALLNQQVPPAKALRHAGLLVWQNGQPDAAIPLLKAVAALAPDEAPIWMDLAGALFAIARPNEARSCLEVSLSLNRSQPYGWLLLATIHNNVGDSCAAEAAFLTALELDQDLADASFGLGLLYFQQRRFEEAAQWLRKLVARHSDNAAGQACLGQALYILGDFSGAASAFAIASKHLPDDSKLLQKLAMVRLIESVIAGTVEAALDIYEKVAGAAGEDIGVVTQRAFHLLSGYGYHDAAAKLGHTRLRWAPDDPVQRYLLAAIEGEALARAPDDYLIEYFNHFADGFDKQLVELLGYRVPEKLHARLEASGRRFARILDLGCGTGLAAPLLRSFGPTLIGVDLAPRMLEKAAERKLYDHLVTAEVISFLADAHAPYDLIFAADLLVYIGDLTLLVQRAARSLQPGGIFAFSIETTQAADFILLQSGRFAHCPSYIDILSRHDFVTLEAVDTTIRLEANRPVAGALFILQRR